MRKNSNIIRAFDALTIVKGINSLGGPDKQVYYIESDVYAPDRRITPLLLQPYVNVSDPNGIITAGDKVSELVDGAWYVDNIDAKNRVTKSSVGSTLDDPFTISDNHLLMVRLNTDKSVMLFFEGDYYDSRKGSKIHISLSYMLSTTHNSQNKPAPKVLLSKGASYTYNPLDDLTELIIESQLADDGKLLRGAVEWCEVEGTKITPISNAMPYYISGQHSDKLKINPSLMGDVVIRARNVSEEFYNKAYGINPEWDSRMKEVFENRNYITHQSPFYEWNNKTVRTISGGDFLYIQDNNLIHKGLIYSIEVRTQSPAMVGAGVYWQWDSLPKGDEVFLRTEWQRVYSLPFNGNAALGLGSNRVGEVQLRFIQAKKDKNTVYTPAPEDLNWENIAKNQLENLALYGAVAKGTLFKDNIKYFNDITYSGNTGDIYGLFILLKAYVLKDKPTGFKFTLKFKLKANKDTAIELTSNNTRYTLESSPNVKKDTEYTFVAYMEIINGNAAHFNTHVNLKDKPTNIQIYEMDIYEGHMDLPYFPTAKELAPDGILPGTYQSDMKFTPLYPNIEADVVYLTTPVIKTGVERIKAQAVLSTNKKTITNPEKHFDIEWILKPTTAGGKETVVSTGEFMDIPVTILPEGRSIGLDLRYNFKKR